MCKFLRRMLVPALFLGFAAPASSERISSDEAKSLAAEFLNSRKILFKGVNLLNLDSSSFSPAVGEDEKYQ